MRDVLIGEISVILRTGLYAIPALIGAPVVIGASKSGAHNLAFPLVGDAVCFLVRLAGVYSDLNVPSACGEPAEEQEGD